MSQIYNVVVYIANDAEASSYRRLPNTHTISATNVDDARKIAQTLLESKGFKVRTMNFTPCKKIVAYTDPQHSVAHVEGWRHKRPPRSTPKL